MEHLTQEELEEFVRGVPPREPEVFRRHLSSCAACSRRLTREARLEVALQQAGLGTAPGPLAARGASRLDWRVPLGVAAAMLIGAGVVWMQASREQPKAARPAASMPVMSEHQLSITADPGAASPGYDVVAPGDVCRLVTIPRAGDARP